ncbi:MAG: L-aspartate oxidase [Chloroflexi bacterium AL-W]|nr:L-aspartate oxidase [Chloroflexi bacterium AL-N1]NOK70285.1 L-aspartate oxidase [Chloroflexi bacterium AL-N10]NOK77822.1 L-aspartate oxidase [Chloroflexi bacterium AL-N5]NOK84831.1 L-aspartate oxidase [Chloroflexi bacterium AL-W]NOK92438.1 L-aspartate oxidase [Chloroflexi bacterium AL-N15]
MSLNLPTTVVDVPRYVIPSLPEHYEQCTTDILVIGGGAAGLAAALRAAEQANVMVLTRGSLPESNSSWAQGGIAAALDAVDSPAIHIADTLVAGAGLSDTDAVKALACEAPAMMREMAQIGVPFERVSEDTFALGLEGGHSRRRILHVGDATGWALMHTLIERVRACTRIRVLECYQAVDLIGAPGRCEGALVRSDDGKWTVVRAQATILATGGAGALYGLTSNQSVALGEGIAMAYRARASVADMEFVQFHPTVFRTRTGTGFLISEATRGEGGRLLTTDGHRFMLDYDPRAELAPRDIVARGIFAAMRQSGSDHVLLDLTHLPEDVLEQHFPTICARCRDEGIDPHVTPIPVAPAAHYLMGGIRTDHDGATDVAGLYAAGECACTGVHGANRLASNSLLECLVFGRRAGAAALVSAQKSASLTDIRAMFQPYEGRSVTTQTMPDWRDRLASIMRTYAGIQRSAGELAAALDFLATLPVNASLTDAESITAANAALTACLIVTSALLREESRGAHFRSDFPVTDDAWRVHLVFSYGQQPYPVEHIADEITLQAA